MRAASQSFNLTTSFLNARTFAIFLAQNYKERDIEKRETWKDRNIMEEGAYTYKQRTALPQGFGMFRGGREPRALAPIYPLAAWFLGLC